MIGIVENVPPQGGGKGNSEPMLNLHKDMGANAVRLTFLWQNVERQKGQFAIDRAYSAMENYLLNARGKGIEPVLILCYGNRFYDGGSFPVSQEAQDAFVQYAKFIAGRFKGAVRYYEVWNEWNIGGGTPAPRRRGDPAVYTTLLKKVYPALKAIDPNIVVLGGATSGVDIGFGTAVAQAGGLAAMDGFSVHPYVYPQPPERALPVLDGMEQALSKAAAGREIPLYATEIGWINVVGPKGNDESTVSNYLSRTFLIFPTRSFVKGVWWYTRYDEGTDPANGMHHMGLYRNDHTEKPAVCAMREVSKVLGAYKPVSVQKQGKDLWVAKLAGPEGSLFAIWTEGTDTQPPFTAVAAQNASISARGICRDVSVKGNGSPSISGVITASPLLLTTSGDSITVTQ